MKILMISPQFYPIVGGYERAAERLSKALVARNHFVTVIAERRSILWPESEIIGELSVKRWWCLYHRHFHILSSLFGLAVWLFKYGRGFQVWHIHQYGAHASLVIFLGKVFHRPVVLKLTSSGKQGLEVTLSSMTFGCLHIWMHRRISACIAVSAETLREALKFGISANLVHKITNGVDILDFHPPTSKERSLAIDSIKICSNFLAVACVS